MIQKGQKCPKTKIWDLNSILPQFSTNFVDFGIKMFVFMSSFQKNNKK